MAITINGSTGISGVDGSTGTPAIIGSDADTGLVFSAGRVQASLNGTSANVGLVSGTAQASTSGTSIDFTGLPSWVKRITVMFDQVSTNGTSNWLVQLGTSSGFVSSGYSGGGTVTDSVSAASVYTAGMGIRQGNAGNSISGKVSICNMTSNRWALSAMLAAAGGATFHSASSISLAATLDRVRITTVNGTDTFDAGTINILYE